MLEEMLTHEAGEEMSNNSADYIQAINEMKQNSVSKEQYNKLKNENKQLLDALVSNKQMDVPEEKPADITELRAKLFNVDQGLSNIEFIDNALKLRAALIAQGEPDPFMPIGTKVQPTYDMRKRLNQLLKDFRKWLTLQTEIRVFLMLNIKEESLILAQQENLITNNLKGVNLNG
jgi:hypothetical protein